MERPEIVADEHLRFLDDLRASGAINMFGARPYIADTFGLDLSASQEILNYWMASFGKENR
jgi:hypothetical protein